MGRRAGGSCCAESTARGSAAMQRCRGNAGSRQSAGEADLIIRRIERRHDETGTVEPGSGDERVDGICTNFAAALVTAADTDTA